MSFQLISDIHVRDEIVDLAPLCDTLVVAGDVSSDLQKVIRQLLHFKEKFRNVLFVPGNHEYYCGVSIESLDQQFKMNLEDHGIQVLQKDHVIIDGRHFVGCTLWSRIPEDYKLEVSCYMNDYSFISDFTPDRSNELYTEHETWLREKVSEILSSDPCADIVVITHHAPRLRGVSAPRYDHLNTTHAFGTDLIGVDSGIKGVKTWVFGHTHFNVNQFHDGIHLVSNQWKTSDYCKSMVL